MLTEKPIFIVSGEKGGVGKSLVAITLIEWCRSIGIQVSVIDTDTVCPDVAAVYESKERCLQIDLSEDADWTGLAEFANAVDGAVVVNMKTGSKAEKHLHSFNNALGNLNRPVVLFFVMGIQKSNVVFFNDALDLYPTAIYVVAVKNLKNGDEDEFFNYDEARNSLKWADKFKDVIDFLFPRVHARVSLQITDEDMTIKELFEGDTLKRGDRAALQIWTGKIFGFYEANRKKFGL